MTGDPMRQAGLERRLANLAKAPRCGARTRTGSPCRQAAVSGRARCRMHGGAKGSGGPPGSRNGNFKHGNRVGAIHDSHEYRDFSGRA
jgi:glucans biosynthesis protein